MSEELSEQQTAARRNSNRRRRAALVALGAIAAFGAAWWFQWPVYSPFRWRHAGRWARTAMVNEFQTGRIERWVGMSRAEVVAELGEPDDEPLELFFDSHPDGAKATQFAARIRGGRCFELISANPGAKPAEPTSAPAELRLGDWKGKTTDELVQSFGAPSAQSHWLVYEVSGAPLEQYLGLSIDAGDHVVNAWIGDHDRR